MSQKRNLRKVQLTINTDIRIGLVLILTFACSTFGIGCRGAGIIGESLEYHYTSLHFHNPSGALTEGSQLKCVCVLVKFGPGSKTSGVQCLQRQKLASER